VTLSVVVLTRNEEKHIRACLESIRAFADEILVLDSGSTDRTCAIARAMGARVEFRVFDNYPAQRNAAMESAIGDWIFFVDADERATPELGKEIEFRISNFEFRIAGFWLPRRNIIFGKEIRHTGWSPDYQPRVLRKGHAHFDPAREVHELVVWDGEVGYLQNPLIHYNYDTLAQFRAKQIAYTRYEARIWYDEGKRARWRGFVGQPLREFWRRFIILEGWKDGAHGLLLSALMAYYAFVRQRMLWKQGNK
jgi:glycosyltransferase involved in cell wall biosynthesis